jgi:hypothetical protein
MKSTATALLMERLEDVNEAVALVETAWQNLAMRQDVGKSMGGEMNHLVVARSLFIESVEGWANAVSDLLTLARPDPDLCRLTACLEHSLRCAAAYVAGLTIADPRRPLTEVPLRGFAPR